MSSALAVQATTNAEAYRASSDAAGLCKAIVLKTAQNIQGRKYVKVEGWQAIAIAHGCTASAEDVQRVPDEGMSGFKAVGIVRRMSDGAEIARAEGFLGDDEGVWAKRPVYARRAMVQTRAISRACRSAFAHVVVMMDAGLSTTPAEEVPEGGFDDGPREAPRDITPARSVHAARKDGGDDKWRAVQKAFQEAETVAELEAAADEHEPTILAFPRGWQTQASELFRERKAELEEAEAALDTAAGGFGAVDPYDKEDNAVPMHAAIARALA